MRLKGTTALVTGGGNGIGRVICLKFATEGAVVAVVDIDLLRANAVAEDIKAQGGVACALAADITKSDDVNRMVAEATDKLGPIDILVNNAGSRITKTFLEHTEADWRQMLDVNLTGHFLCCKAVVPRMITNGGGSIVNIASVASYVGRPNRIAYCAAKGGLLAFTRALALDLNGTNIRVNAIAPGLIETPLHAEQGETPTAGPGVNWGKETLVGRWGQPDDVANAAVYFASADSSFVTGADLRIDGGWLAAKTRSGEV